MSLVMNKTCGQVVEIFNLKTCKHLQSVDVVVCLNEAWEILTRCQVLIPSWRIYSKGEEDLVVDVHVLSYGLVGIQRCKFAFNDSLGALVCRLKEVIVYFADGSVLLHAHHEVLNREVPHHLELLIPLSGDLGVGAKQRIDGPPNILCIGDLDLLFSLGNPVVHFLGWLSDEIWLCLQNGTYISLQILAERRRQLV